MVYAQLGIRPGEWNAQKILWNVNVQTDHLISDRRVDRVIFNEIKITCWIVDFAVPAGHRV